MTQAVCRVMITGRRMFADRLVYHSNQRQATHHEYDIDKDTGIVMNGRYKFTHSRSASTLTAMRIKRLADANSRRQHERIREELLQSARKEQELVAMQQEQEQMQEILQGAASRVIEEQERTDTILSALGQGLFGLDGCGCVQFLNPACERMMGWSENQLQGIPLHDLLHPAQHRATPCTEETCPLQRVLSQAVSQRIDNDMFHGRNGAPLPVSYFCTPVYRSGVQIGALICFDDITERLAAAQALDEYARQVKAQNEQLFSYCEELTETQKRLELQAEELTEKNAQILETNLLLKGLATTDGMTGLANHRAFQEAIRTVWYAGRKQSGARLVSLMLLDVDAFKAYNDSYGHPAGDEVLKILAMLLRQNMRDSDLIARYGGEEFVIIVWDADHDATLRLSTRLCQIVEQYPFENRKITVSIGIATQDVRDSTPATRQNVYKTPDELIKAADEALYEAKRSGRNRVCIAKQPALAA